MPIALNAATFVGNRMAGIPGSWSRRWAVSPSLIIVLLLARRAAWRDKAVSGRAVGAAATVALMRPPGSPFSTWRCSGKAAFPCRPDWVSSPASFGADGAARMEVAPSRSSARWLRAAVKLAFGI